MKHPTHISVIHATALLSIFSAQVLLAQDTATVNQGTSPGTTVIINNDRNAPQTTETESVDSSPNAQATATAGTGGDTIGAQTPAQRTELQRRRIAYDFTSIAFGPASMQKMGVDDKLCYSLLVGQLWEVNPHAAIKANFEVTSEFQHAVMGLIDLGANFYLLNADVAPYLGADLGFGLGYEANGDIPYGFALGGAIGIVLFRTSTVQMSIEGKANVIFETKTKSFPTIYSGRVSVLL